MSARYLALIVAILAVTAPARADLPKHPKLSLANGHANVACKTCHDRGNDKPPSKGSTCASCHAPVHVAKLGTDCERCHASIQWTGLADSIGRAAHGKTRYPLAGKHATVACDACHARSKPEAERYRGTRFDACNACHDDAHHGEFKSRAGGECAACHTVAGFLPTTFGVAQHASTGYALDGRHAATPCSGCHPASRPRLSWLVGQAECLDCHENPHGTQYAKEMTTGGCALCHTSVSWHQSKLDHSTWPLTGAHARTSCAACHGAQKQGADAAAYRGIPRTCEGCHEDTHAGQFRQSEPAKACTSCHATEAWTITAFDHRKTRYPLDGAHVPLPCDRCHPQATLRDGSRAIRWRLGYTKCKDCHADPHRNREMDCIACHGANSWKLSTGAGTSGFDHERTGFALRGAHVQTACTGCHRGGKPTLTCAGCHRDPHQGRMAGECYECHTAVAWSDVKALEQHRRTRMPLTGAHAVIECTACHTRQTERTYSDLPIDCYACHQDEYHESSTHPNHDGTDPLVPSKPFPRDCGLCHRSTTWAWATTDPSTVMPRVQRAREHDPFFELSTGSHRGLDCAACHVDGRRTRAVRCDGCHMQSELRSQHRSPVSIAPTACLRCHPRGARR